MEIPIVIYEDNHLIAVNKPAGWLVQADSTGDATLADWVRGYIKLRYNKPGDVFLGTIHRLDRPVSGVVIFARTSKALSRMNELMRNRAIEKVYWAIANERPNPLSGTLKHYILKDSSRNIVKAYDQRSNRNAGAKEAILDYYLLAGLGQQFLIEVRPKTGRPHQIRVQMSKLGCPIKGDLKYGSTDKLKNGSIFLHCRSMSFIHPVKKEKITITAKPWKNSVWLLFEDHWM